MEMIQYMEKWLKWAIELQSMAQNGLAYANNEFDKERYERLREISAEMLRLTKTIMEKNFLFVQRYF